MWVTLVLVGLVLVFSRSVRVDALASANYVSALEARATAQGATQYVLSRLAMFGDDPTAVLGEPCEALQVGRGLFWVLRADLEEDRAYAFGLRDEAAKINLNSASIEMLLRLPGMTAELAGAIVDWRDGNSEVSPGGAENEYYLLLPQPYYCKNAPFESVEELLLVKDASPEILYGEDVNRNGVLDPNENDGADSEPPDDGDGRLDRGLLDYVTVYSSEPNVSRSGEERINVNQLGSQQQLAQLLREAIPDDRFFQVMDRVRSGRPFRNVLDFYYRTDLEASEFAQVADRLTTRNEEVLVGMVNVNTAPREVLLCLPELDESDAETLLAQRADAGTDLTNLAWVAEALPAEKGTEIGDYISVASHQYSADIVAVSGDGRAYRRFRVVLDALSTPPRMLYGRDLTHLGWPLDPEIMELLRSGEGPASASYYP